jgi:hypothetical protein
MNYNIEKLRYFINEHFKKIEQIKNLKQPAQPAQPKMTQILCNISNCTNLQCPNIHPCTHYEYHINIFDPVQIQVPVLPELPEPPKHIKQPAIYEYCVDTGGLSNVGVILQNIYPNARIGTMVAGNSGRPGGACGQADGTVYNLHAYHTTQEEDIMSNWLMTAAYKTNDSHIGNKLYQNTIYYKWGMINPYGIDHKTIQNVDYTIAKPPYYADAWVVRNAELSFKNMNDNKLVYNNKNMLVPETNYDFTRSYQTSLVFVAGPNCGSNKDKGPSSSMRRTFNYNMSKDYDLFKEGVKAALFAGLCAMAKNGCTIALLAYVSAGIYGGDHKYNLRRDFESIVNELLKRKCSVQNTTKVVTLGSYFDRVILTKLN